jgi:hypothetical protein
MRDLLSVSEVGVEKCKYEELITYLCKHIANFPDEEELDTFVRLHFGQADFLDGKNKETKVEELCEYLNELDNDELCEFVVLSFGVVEDCNFDTEEDLFIIDLDPDKFDDE